MCGPERRHWSFRDRAEDRRIDRSAPLNPNLTIGRQETALDTGTPLETGFPGSNRPRDGTSHYPVVHTVGQKLMSRCFGQFDPRPAVFGGG